MDNLVKGFFNPENVKPTQQTLIQNNDVDVNLMSQLKCFPLLSKIVGFRHENIVKAVRLSNNFIITGSYDKTINVLEKGQHSHFKATTQRTVQDIKISEKLNI